MTETHQAREFAKRAGRAALGPVTTRLDLLRRDLDIVWAKEAELAAAIEQATAATQRLEVYFDRFREEVWNEVRAMAQPEAEPDAIDEAVAITRSISTELDPAEGAGAIGAALRLRLEHGLLHAEAVATEVRQGLHQELSDLRGSTRLTQALVERALAASLPGPAPTDAPAAAGVASDAAPATSVPTAAPAAASGRPAFAHPVPSFDLLYRAFEDRHRGKPEEITARQGDDYLELLDMLPHPDLAIADLGCGRGELVRLLDEHGLNAIGVDSNEGQIGDGEERLFVTDDLIHWLDVQADGSLRAVVAMHVVEHLPLDLQIRLVFESRRVLADGGLLVLETPNTLSLSTAATNFWVDPTHERPVHPALLEFLAVEAGFGAIELRPLHPMSLAFRGAEAAPELVDDLNSLILGAGDMALLARR
jgi:SAM-dependent methyltransferase